MFYVKIKVYPEFGNAYFVDIPIDDDWKDDNLDIWISDNLINVQEYKIVEHTG